MISRALLKYNIDIIALIFLVLEKNDGSYTFFLISKNENEPYQCDVFTFDLSCSLVWSCERYSRSVSWARIA